MVLGSMPMQQILHKIVLLRLLGMVLINQYHHQYSQERAATVSHGFGQHRGSGEHSTDLAGDCAALLAAKDGIPISEYHHQYSRERARVRGVRSVSVQLPQTTWLATVRVICTNYESLPCVSRRWREIGDFKHICKNHEGLA